MDTFVAAIGAEDVVAAEFSCCTVGCCKVAAETTWPVDDDGSTICLLFVTAGGCILLGLAFMFRCGCCCCGTFAGEWACPVAECSAAIRSSANPSLSEATTSVDQLSLTNETVSSPRLN